MNTSFFLGVILLLLGATGVWASRIKFPNAPFFFQEGNVFNFTRVSYFLGLLGAFLIFWGIFAKIKNYTLSLILRLFVLILAVWIGYKFYQTNVWDWRLFFNLS